MRGRRRRFKRMRKKARTLKPKPLFEAAEFRFFTKYEINVDILKDAYESGAFV